MSKNQILFCHTLLPNWTTLSGDEPRKAAKDSYSQPLQSVSTAGPL